MATIHAFPSLAVLRFLSRCGRNAFNAYYLFINIICFRAYNKLFWLFRLLPCAACFAYYLRYTLTTLQREDKSEKEREWVNDEWKRMRKFFLLSSPIDMENVRRSHYSYTSGFVTDYDVLLAGGVAQRIRSYNVLRTEWMGVVGGTNKNNHAHDGRWFECFVLILRLSCGIHWATVLELIGFSARIKYRRWQHCSITLACALATFAKLYEFRWHGAIWAYVERHTPYVSMTNRQQYACN